MNPGSFYALPQSPQTFKQLLMVSGLDKYFQIVKCFRDEDLRADRQPEFTQVDCEMSFVTQEEILNTFEGLTRNIFQKVLQVDLGDFPRMTYDEAMTKYGSDKPDMRFDMEFVYLKEDVSGKDFAVFDQAENVIGIVAKGCEAQFSNKDMKDLTEWVQRPQLGAKGLVYVKYGAEGIKSTVGKFYSDEDLKRIGDKYNIENGDLLLILCAKPKNEKQLGELRLEMGRRLGLMRPGDFKPLWVVDFPLLEWDDDTQRFYAMHHPFTSPKKRI
jgi:aspartyl-tRNA synthetase